MMNKYSPLNFCYGVVLLLLMGGCVYSPGRDALSDLEVQSVRTRFTEMVTNQRACHCCLDGAVKIRFDNFFYAGSVSGYLQAMSPSYLKFIALSPLGQPLAVLTSDGATFHYVDVAKQIEHRGEVSGATFGKYAPPGFSPEFTYYWLTGTLRPGSVTIMPIKRHDNGKQYWLEIQYTDGQRGLLLFDPILLHIYQHIVYDQNGDVILEMLYDNYGKGGCGLPGSVMVTSLTLNTTLHISLDDLVDQVSLSRPDFSYTVPAHFKRDVVE